jgi:hypothetical protein
MIVSSLLLLDFQAPALNLIRIVTIIPMKSIPLPPRLVHARHQVF